MKRNISIFAFLLCAFAAVGLTGTAEAGVLRTYYKTPAGTFGGPDASVVYPETATTLMQTPTDFTAYPGNGEKVEGWYYYSNTPAQRGTLLDPAGTGNPLTLKIEDSADRYLYAHFAWITYKVKYDADGGSGAPAESSGNSYNSNFTVSSTVPTKSGYTFAGWKADSNGTIYSKGAVVAGSELCKPDWHDDNQVVTLTAQWTKEQYTISTAVEPTGAGNVTGAGTYDFGTQVSLTATANSGWQFERWKDGGTDNPRTVTVGAAAVTYTAVFKQLTVVKPTVTKSFTYDGTEKTCATAGDHYTVTGNTGTNVGEYTFTAKLTDGYAWSDGSTADYTVSWTINAATITGVTLASTSITYDGQPHQPTVVSVTANGKTFSSPDTGWTVVYQRNGVETSDFTNAGTITVRVTGTGNLTGSYTAYFTIGTREIRMDEVVFDDLTETYDGTEKTIKASNVPSGVTATYSSNTRTIVGEQQAWVTFKPNDNNHTVSLNQKLATLKIEQATITAIALSGASATYDGQSHKPTIGWVTANNKTFSNVNTGWDVTYLRDGLATGDFTSQGAITVTATGNSNLKGAASATFTINPATIESVTLTSMSATYDGQPHQPTVASVRANGRSFTSASTGWTVACTRNGAATTDFTSAGAITVTVTGKTGLSGTASATFTINPAAISAITLREASATYDGNPHQPAVASVTANGKTFTDAAIGWDVTYDKDDFTSVGNIRVTATGKNNLTGSANATFEIKSKSITVTFDSNGGNAPSPASKTVQCPGTYGTLATCTRKGYDFTGWWTAKEGGTQITETTTVELSASQTLYARWEAKRYTLTIALKEGESYGAYKGPQNYQLPNPLIFGETNLNEIAVAYKKDDADFQGYFTSAGAMVYDAQGRNVKGALGEYWTNNYPIGTYCYDGNLTLSARFADPREHYQVTVTASPAEAGTVDPSGTATYVEGSNIVLTATANTGYSFWHWTKDGAEVSTEKEYPITVTADAEYVAVFTGNVYKIQFMRMDGGPEDLIVDETFGEYWKLPTVQRPGYVAKWYSLPMGQGEQITAETLFDRIPQYPFVYAKWDEIPPVVTFADPEGGHESISEKRTKGQPIGEPAKGTENWKRDGYWRDNDSDWDPPLSTDVTGNMTVNAKWTSIADVLDCTNLMFSASGDWKPYAADYVKGDSCMRLESQNGVLLTTVTNSGTLTFSWKGGYLGSKATEFQVKVGSADPVTFTSTSEMDWVRTNLVISATGETKVQFSCRTFSEFCQIDFVTWEEGKGPEKSFTISFDANGGSGSMEKIVCKEGESFTFPDNDFTPPDAGATFLGWNENAECSGKTYVPTDSLKATADRTFYAKWRYTIAYKPGAYSRGQNYSDAKDHGASVTLRDKEYSHNSGALYVQDGWSVNEDGSTPDYALKETYSANESVTLYPHWKSLISDALDCPALEFSASGGWSVVEDQSAVNGSCMRLATYDGANAITVEIRESGKLSFDWKGVYEAKPTKMNVYIGDMETPAVVCAAKSDETGFVTFGPYEITASSDAPVVVKFAGLQTYFSGCSLDHVVWTPEGGGEPTPGESVKPTAAGVEGNMFSLTIPTDPDTDYGVWTNADLTVDSWGLMGEPQKGEGKPMEFKWTIVPELPQLFFRAHEVEYK